MKLFLIFLLTSNCFAKWPAHLEHFKEQPLTQLAKLQADHYRLMICPTFSEAYLFNFKVTDKETGNFKVKILSGKGGYGAGPLKFEQSFVIKGAEFKALIKKLRTPNSKTPYFGLPEDTIDLLSGTDGSQVIFEGIEDQKPFHSNLWSPEYACAVFPHTGLEKDPKYQNFYKSLSPYFLASHALMETARSRIKWTSEMDEDFVNFARAKVSNSSPVFRQALSILNKEAVDDESDPFSVTSPAPATKAEHKKARELLAQALLETPESFIIHHELAKSYLESEKDFKSAEHHFSKAIALDPLNEALIVDRGAMFLKAGEITKAELDLRTLTHLKSDFAPMLQEAIDEAQSAKK